MRLTIFKNDLPIRSMSLLKERLTIGRAASCTVVLDGPGISQLHAILDRADDEDAYLISDLSSGGGTRLNGAQIEDGVVRVGDRLSIGGYEVRFTADAVADMSAEEKTAKVLPLQRPSWAERTEKVTIDDPVVRRLRRTTLRRPA